MRLALGFAAGWVLLALRAAPGDELLSLPWVLPRHAALLRAAALALVGWGLLPFRQLFDGERPTTEFLWGVALGVVCSGVLAPLPVAGPAGPGIWVLPLIGYVLWSTSRSAGRRARARAAEAAGSAPDVPHDPGFQGGEPTAEAWAEADAQAAAQGSGTTPRRRQGGGDWLRFLSLPLLGAAVALALEALARPVARGLAADAADEAALAATVALLVAAGAGAFGGLSSPRSRRELPGWLLPTLLGLTVVSAWVGLRGLGNVLPNSALRELCARVGLDPSDAGTLAFDGLLAATVLGVPALLLGSALHGARHAREWVALGSGAALALLLVPDLLDDARRAELLPVTGSLVLLQAAAWAGLWGGGLASLATRRPWPLLVGATGVALSLTTLPESLVVPRLWQRFPRDFVAWSELPEGQVMRMADGVGSATLDHVALGAALRADADGLEGVRARFEAAFGLLPEEVRARGANVLLVGQLDEPRRTMLELLGAARVDRCAAWWAAMEPLERELCGGPELPGRVIEPYEARLELKAGAYDLVFVPPLPRRCPRPADLVVPEGTRLVLWVDGASPVAALPLDGPVLLVNEGLSGLSVGLTLPALEGDQGLEPGEPLPAPWAVTRLGLREWERDDPARARLCRRLAAGAREGRRHALLLALAELYDAQRLSSPFEEPEQRTELPVGVLDALRDAALLEPGRAPDALELGLLAALGQLLVGKRDVEAIVTHLEPVYEAWGRPVELLPALVHGDLEQLDPERALQRLSALGPREGLTDTLLELRARAERQALDATAELRTRRELLDRDPGDAGRERAWLEARVRANDPGAGEAVEAWLVRHPEDEAMRDALRAGPLDDGGPREGAFTPGADHGPGADHHDSGGGAHGDGPPR